jgi:prolyl-tRNA synthetase
VTKSGQSDLAEPIAIRPTSETIMYPAYAQWIRSHRDLPLKLNQWTSVVRWEFKDPTPFLRTREFLWQEGHTAHATFEDADKMVYDILDLYRRVYEELLAVPVIKGVKSEGEKFAGGHATTTIEGFIPTTGRGIQAATSHHLGQNFSKMFDITFEDENKQKQMVWQTSWGLTTRSIGVMIMNHGDDKGLVLPPRVAPLQVVLIPIPFKEEPMEPMVAKLEELGKLLNSSGIRAKVDAGQTNTPGWKFNHYELKGVPIRIELGPRDMKSSSVMLVRRDTAAKQSASWATLVESVRGLCDEIQKSLFAKAKANMDAGIEKITEWKNVTPALNRKHLILAPWCEDPETEDEMKKKTTEEALELLGDDPKALTGAMKSLCIPLEQDPMPKGQKCFFTGKPAKRWCLFGRSY